jgi:hypothetical protein
MRILWTLLKVSLGLAIAIPLAIVALVVSLGVLGALLGLALMTLKLVCVAFIGYALFRLVQSFVAPSRNTQTARVHALPMPDQYYEAAMRELDAEMGHAPSR